MNKEQYKDRLSNFEKGSDEWLREKEDIRKEKARAYYFAKRKGVDISFFQNEKEKELQELLAKYIGTVGYLSVQSSRVNFRVLNAKREYGNLRLLVEPISGEGTFWTQKLIFPEA